VDGVGEDEHEHEALKQRTLMLVRAQLLEEQDASECFKAGGT